jgi:hypothetical protein
MYHLCIPVGKYLGYDLGGYEKVIKWVMFKNEWFSKSQQKPTILQENPRNLPILVADQIIMINPGRDLELMARAWKG